MRCQARGAALGTPRKGGQEGATCVRENMRVWYGGPERWHVMSERAMAPPCGASCPRCSPGCGRRRPRSQPAAPVVKYTPPGDKAPAGTGHTSGRGHTGSTGRQAGSGLMNAAPGMCCPILCPASVTLASRATCPDSLPACQPARLTPGGPRGRCTLPQTAAPKRPQRGCTRPHRPPAAGCRGRGTAGAPAEGGGRGRGAGQLRRR